MWKEHRTDELVMLNLELEHDLMSITRVTLLKLKYFGHVV